MYSDFSQLLANEHTELHTNVELFVCWKIEFKVLHMLRCFVHDESSSELSWCEPERVAGLTVQLEFCMHPANNTLTNLQVMTHTAKAKYSKSGNFAFDMKLVLKH